MAFHGAAHQPFAPSSRDQQPGLALTLVLLGGACLALAMGFVPTTRPASIDDIASAEPGRSVRRRVVG